MKINELIVIKIVAFLLNNLVYDYKTSGTGINST
jgi:hypothetical protein